MKSASEYLETDALIPSRAPRLLPAGKMEGGGSQIDEAGQESGSMAPAVVREVLNSPGQAMSPDTRSPMEHRFSHDFSGVRLHTDAKAGESAKAVGAAAYTVGNHVVFGQNQFVPGTPRGNGLLAHELAHVSQQGGIPDAADRSLRLGPIDHSLEKQADRIAAGSREFVARQPGASGLLQRSPPGVDLAPGIPGVSQTLGSTELEPGEALSSKNPKLSSIAQSYKGSSSLSSSARVRITANLPSSAQYDSAQEKSERAKLAGRMRQVRDALVALGVPADAIDISPASAYATSANGQVSVQVSKLASPMLLPPLPAAVPPGALPGPVAPAAPAAGGLPSIDLDVKIGPVTVSIPKEVRAKLPIPLKGAKSLVVDIGYEVPAKFSLKLTLDGTPYLRVSVKAGAEIDTKNASATGSVGLVIETTSTTYNAVDPGETRLKLKKAGEALNKAAQEYAAAGPDDKLGKAIDIASALGEIYDAVDKAGKKATPVPRATFEFGYKKLLTPGDETDRSKLPPSDFIGGTATFHF